MAKQAFIPNLEPLIQMGINPRTGLPIKVSNIGTEQGLTVFDKLNIIDRQDAVNRYVWYNLPCDLSSQELENLLYSYYELAFFYYPVTGQFYFMRFALDGQGTSGLDFYGRMTDIHPIPINWGHDDKGNLIDNFKADAFTQAQYDYLSTLHLKVVYGIKDIENLTEEDLYNSAIIIRDYTPNKAAGNVAVPRQCIQQDLIKAMSEVFEYSKTSALLSTGVTGITVTDADEAFTKIDTSNRLVKQGALTGKPFIPVTGDEHLQQLTLGQGGKAEEFTLLLQSMDNLRLSMYGIDNGGLFEKKAHTLQSEQDMNGGPVGLVLQDGLQIRQNFCNIVNSIWGLGIWCEPNENIIGADIDGDGLMYDRNEGENSGAEGGQDNGNDSNDSNV